MLGAVAIPFGLWMRSHLPETPDEPEAVATVPDPVPNGLRRTRARWHIMALGLVILASGTIASYIFTYIATYAQATLHLEVARSFRTRR